MVFGYGLLCDFIRNVQLILINIGSDVATRRNLVDPIQRTNMRGLMAERFRGSNPGYFCSFYFFPFIFYFMCNFFSTYFSILSPFFSSIEFV
jgi:hypothetical protein